MNSPCILADAGIFIGGRLAGGDSKTGIKGSGWFAGKTQQKDSENAKTVIKTMVRMFGRCISELSYNLHAGSAALTDTLAKEITGTS